MFSERWVYFVVGVLLLGLILQQGAVISIGVLAGMTLGVAWLWQRYALVGVEYERTLSQTRVFPGEKVDLTLRLTNRKLLPLPWLQVDDEFPRRLPLTKGKLEVSSSPHTGLLSHLAALRWYERVSWRHQLEAASRGYYAFGPLRLRSGDVFGLFQVEQHRLEQTHLIVYPRLVPLRRLGLPAKEPFGEIRSTYRICEDASRTMGIRDYQQGDALKRIHWKATARRQRLQVRVYEPTATQNLVIFLNVSTFAYAWQGTDPQLLEGAITVTASLAQYALDERYAVGVFANGPMLQGDQAIRVRPSRSPEQLTAILEALAKLTPFVLLTLEDMLEAEVPRLPWGATLVVVTAVVGPELVAVLSRLREAGRRLVLVTFGELPAGDDLHGIVAYHMRGEHLLSGI